MESKNVYSNESNKDTWDDDWTYDEGCKHKSYAEQALEIAAIFDVGIVFTPFPTRKLNPKR